MIMSEYKEICGYTVWNFNFDEEYGYAINGLMATGACFQVAVWLNNEDISDDTPLDVYNSNTSGIRDGNRLDFMDDYLLGEENGNEYYLSNIYIHVNGLVYIHVYNSTEGKYEGYIEIPNI